MLCHNWSTSDRNHCISTPYEIAFVKNAELGLSAPEQGQLPASRSRTLQSRFAAPSAVSEEVNVAMRLDDFCAIGVIEFLKLVAVMLFKLALFHSPIQQAGRMGSGHVVLLWGTKPLLSPIINLTARGPLFEHCDGTCAKLCAEQFQPFTNVDF